MHTVPFDSLGPGQKGRLVYQVIGKNGPIMNPSNIRYLPADSPAVKHLNPVAGLAGNINLAVGLSAANLMCSVGTLAIAAQTAHQISILHEKISSLHTKIDRIEGKVDQILETVKRIDTKVAENNLRHALNYILEKSITLDGINLHALLRLESDIETFEESLSEPLLFNFGVQLSSDVQDKLQLLCGLLHSVRKMVAQYHNLAVDGDPQSSIIFNSESDYFYKTDLSTIVEDAILYNSSVDVFNKTKWAVGYDVKKRFFLADRKDGNHYERLIDKKLNNAFDRLFIPREGKEFVDLVSKYLPKKYFEASNYEEKQGKVYSTCLLWLYHSDAGLLYRTKVELDALKQGYDQVMWHHLNAGSSCPLDRIDVSCNVPAIEDTRRLKI